MLACIFAFAAAKHAAYPPHYVISNGMIVNYLETIPESSGTNYKAEFDQAMKDLEDIDIDAIQQLADSDYAPAVHVLAELNLYGLGIEQNITEAAKLFKKSAKLGESESLARLAVLYRYGLGVRRDTAKSALFRQLSCDRGSVLGCVSLSVSLCYGFDVWTDPRRGVETFHPVLYMATRTHDGRLPYELGFLSQNLNLSNDRELRKVAEAEEFEVYGVENSGKSSLEAAQRRFYRRRGPDDVQIAKEVFLRYADEPEIAYLLGEMYFVGDGVEADLDLAEKYLRPAVQNGIPKALRLMSQIRMRQGNMTGARFFSDQAALRGDWTSRIINAELAINAGNMTEADKWLGVMDETEPEVAYLMEKVFLSVERDMPDAGCLPMRKIAKAPWLQTQLAAEDLWRQGNRKGATVLWIESSDVGSPTSMYNAMTALRNCEKVTGTECFLPDQLRWKIVRQIATMMYSSAGATFPLRPQVLDWIVESYEKTGKGRDFGLRRVQSLPYQVLADIYYFTRTFIDSLESGEATDLVGPIDTCLRYLDFVWAGTVDLELRFVILKVIRTAVIQTKDLLLRRLPKENVAHLQELFLWAYRQCHVYLLICLVFIALALCVRLRVSKLLV